jgi:NAD(P)-dependent dehydrogenase (short-subunit alcohol dehydrogenase family)
VVPGDAYTVSCPPAGDGRTRIEVASAGRLTAAITITTDRAAPALQRPPEHEPGANARAARAYSLEQLARIDAPISEPYACRLGMLSALAADLGAGSVPQALLSWLSAASYTVGMLLPGRDAVFVGGRIARSPADRVGTLTASVSTADARTGVVIVQAALEQQEASARMTLQAFLCSTPPAPNRSSIGGHLAPSTELAGRNVLVVGASRGLGAALSGAFASQEATVWAAFSRSEDRAEAVRREFGAERVRLLQFDASDTEQARRAFAALRHEARTLDGVVLCAAPPTYETALHPDASEATLRFVAASVAMTLVPLAEALQLLSAEGWLVLTSSWALDDPPATWPHYIVAKAAIEGAAAYCARHTPAAVLVVRPPKMWTDSTNTPLGRIGAAATEEVAGAIVRWATNHKPASGVSLLSPGDLAERSSSTAPRT